MLKYFATSLPSARFEPITRYIAQILIGTNLNGPPWIHHVYPLLRHLGHQFLPQDGSYSHTPPIPSIVTQYALPGPYPFILSLDFLRPHQHGAEATPDLNSWPHSSIHFSLPRTLPACYRTLYAFRLYNLHFRSLAYLLRVVKELEGLRALDLLHTTWDSPDGSSALQLPGLVRFPVYEKLRFLTVAAYKCTDNALAVTIPFYQPSWRYSHKNHLSVAREDMQIVTRVADWIHASYRSLQSTQARLRVTVNRNITHQGSEFRLIGLVSENGTELFRPSGCAYRCGYKIGAHQWRKFGLQIKSSHNISHHLAHSARGWSDDAIGSAARSTCGSRILSTFQ